MLLAIDLGNTNLTIGLYEGETLVHHWRLATEDARMPDEYGLQLLGLLTHADKTPADLTGICLASVVPPLTTRIAQACREYLKREPLIVDAGVRTGIRIRYDDPKAVGADRVADAVAVHALYGGPACVVDFGTATTFNAVTMVEGMVSRFRAELGKEMKVIATGGLAETVAKETNVIDVIAPWLTLDGLRIIWEMNQTR
ncbi:MAG: hypothetical protein B6D40_11785 [Anaerolineae bacterium UTCFX3]|nr:MAG: hypothetical protein B6D40_11785 [Anaerolineae bacterium UTCFX3]